MPSLFSPDDEWPHASGLGPAAALPSGCESGDSPADPDAIAASGGRATTMFSSLMGEVVFLFPPLRLPAAVLGGSVFDSQTPASRRLT